MSVMSLVSHRWFGDEVVDVQVHEGHLGSRHRCPDEAVRHGHPVHVDSLLDASGRSVSQRICGCLLMRS